MSLKFRMLAGCAALGLTLAASEASAQMVIKNPDQHPVYRAELEPHGVAVFWRGRYHGRYNSYYGGRGFGDPEFGAGFRASIEVGDPAFIPSINNTVAISFGIDITSCNCGSFNDVRLYFPVAVQWNFWLTESWSVFADLGIVPNSAHGGFDDDFFFDPYLAAGGRYNFNDDIALVMRIGYPISFTIGPSFFVGD